MAEKLQQLLLTAVAATIKQQQQMNALMAVMHQRLIGVDIKVAQPIQPVHEGLMEEFGTKTDVAQCSNEKSDADINKCYEQQQNGQSFSKKKEKRGKKGAE